VVVIVGAGEEAEIDIDWKIGFLVWVFDLKDSKPRAYCSRKLDITWLWLFHSWSPKPRRPNKIARAGYSQGYESAGLIAC
jgi:hypothetical protein